MEGAIRSRSCTCESLGMYVRPPLPMLSTTVDLSRVAGLFWQVGDAFLDELAAYLRGKTVLETFAGNGYLAGLLSDRGIKVIATSLFTGWDGHGQGLYHPVEDLDAVEAVERHHAQCDIHLMCWPTTTKRAYQASLLWERLKGAPTIFIGEVTDLAKGELGGCATDEFHENFVEERVFASYIPRNLMERARVGRLKQPGSDAEA